MLDITLHVLAPQRVKSLLFVENHKTKAAGLVIAFARLGDLSGFRYRKSPWVAARDELENSHKPPDLSHMHLRSPTKP